MLGAIIGDIVGSPYEFDCNNIKVKDFPLFSEKSCITDDTVMTMAVGEGFLESLGESDDKVKMALICAMQKYGEIYPNMGYGSNFIYWLQADNPAPYGSYGNGSAMRVSSVAWIFDDLDKVLHHAKLSAEISHNHTEGIIGAQATAAAIFLARNNYSKEEIKNYISKTFKYDLSKTCDEIRPNYYHVESCMQTVPEALTAFFESNSFEDAIRLAVSLGGDSDTLAAITGSVAETYYGTDVLIAEQAVKKLDRRLKASLGRFLLFRLTKYSSYFKELGFTKEAYQGRNFDEFLNIFTVLKSCIPIRGLSADICISTAQTDEVLGMIERYIHIAQFSGFIFRYAMKENGFYQCLNRLKETMDR